MNSLDAFVFSQMPVLKFGWQITQDELAAELLNKTSSELVLITGSFVADNFLSPRLDEVFLKRNVQHFVVKGEPSPEVVDEIVSQASSGAELVVGFGGGSVLDAAKAVAGLIPNPFPVVDFLEGVGVGRELENAPLPFVAIPTTAGTGSETTKNAVISRVGSFKKSFRDDRLLAQQVWLDPEFLSFCPQEVFYPTAMDALTQLIESYTTFKANPITDALALKGVELFKEALELLENCSDDSDESRRDAFGSLILAAALSGITLANAGLGAVHGLAGPIGAYFPAPHGLVCAKLLAPVTQANLTKLELEEKSWALKKYADLAEVLTGARSLVGLVDYLRDLSLSYVPQGLAEFGLREDNLASVLESCRAGSMLGNPTILSDEALELAIISAL